MPNRRFYLSGVIPGLVKAGNIDLFSRPVAFDLLTMSKATVRSISIGTPRGEVLIPTVIGGKILSDRQAIAHYQKSGQHLGIFATAKNATAYAKRLHKQQERLYAGQRSPAWWLNVPGA